MINQPQVYPISPQNPWVNHFVAWENVYLATIERFDLGSLQSRCFAWGCYNSNEMEDLQEPKVFHKAFHVGE